MKLASRKMFVVGALLVYGQMTFAGDDPFADVMVSYVQGSNPSSGYVDPNTSLGPPERFTGEEIPEFQGVVSEFSPPWGTDEIVSIGEGGHLIVQFNTPVADDPNNPYGVDLIIFANTGFVDSDFPNGVVGGAFGSDGGTIEVSADGSTWFLIEGRQADGVMPTIGYLDSGPYDEAPGTTLTDFTRPVDPAMALKHVLGDSHDDILAKFHGSGGGVSVDISETGLSEISYVRISNPVDAPDGVEVDAFADVAPRLPGDANYDGVIDVDDLGMVFVGWGMLGPGDPPADFDNDRDVDVDDLGVVFTNWTTKAK